MDNNLHRIWSRNRKRIVHGTSEEAIVQPPNIDVYTCVYIEGALQEHIIQEEQHCGALLCLDSPISSD